MNKRNKNDNEHRIWNQISKPNVGTFSADVVRTDCMRIRKINKKTNNPACSSLVRLVKIESSHCTHRDPRSPNLRAVVGWGVLACLRFRGCVHRRCHPHRDTRATRRVASATNVTKHGSNTTRTKRTIVSRYVVERHAKRPRKHRATRSSRPRKSILYALLLETSVTSRPKKGLFRAIVREQYRCPSAVNTIDEPVTVDFDLD